MIFYSEIIWSGHKCSKTSVLSIFYKSHPYLNTKNVKTDQNSQTVIIFVQLDNFLYLDMKYHILLQLSQLFNASFCLLASFCRSHAYVLYVETAKFLGRNWPHIIFWQVIEAQVDMPIVGAITLYVSLLTFTLRVHPDRLDYVDQILVISLPFFNAILTPKVLFRW